MSDNENKINNENINNDSNKNSAEGQKADNSQCGICHKHVPIFFKYLQDTNEYQGVCLNCAMTMPELGLQDSCREMGLADNYQRRTAELDFMANNFKKYNPQFAEHLFDFENMRKFTENLNSSITEYAQEMGVDLNDREAMDELITETLTAELDKKLASFSDETDELETSSNDEDEERIPNEQLDNEIKTDAVDNDSDDELSDNKSGDNETPEADNKSDKKKSRPQKKMKNVLDDVFKMLGGAKNIIAFNAGDVDGNEFSDFDFNTGDMEDETDESSTFVSADNKAAKVKIKFKFLEKYGSNLTRLAKENKLDRMIGRESELDRVIQILNRRGKNNPVLIGEPGVGKTAIAEGLAVRVAEGRVPVKLLNLQIFLVDMTALLAGTQFRGQFEKRIQNLVKEATQSDNIILVIDELHNIMGGGSAEGAMNAANILKPALAKGKLRILGSTTIDEYRKFIEEDSALERRFQKVLIEEPTIEETIKILKGIRDYYEEHHNVTYSDSLIVDLVHLAKRYIHDRYFPDKAIDIIDEAGSKSNLNQHLLAKKQILVQDLDLMNENLEKLNEKLTKTEFKDLELLEEYSKAKAEYEAKKLEYDTLSANIHPVEIKIEDVAAVIEMWTGIPVKALTETEKNKLINIEQRLKKYIIGQDQAIEAVAGAIRRRRSGFADKNRPASFIFVGPTGVGKTQLVKILAKELFGKASEFLRFDMSEFMEAHTVSKLIGAPPGYVGYDNAGQLTEKIRRHPYSVILFDEIEKAHVDVFNLLLQMLDEGHITDSKGRKINCSNCIMVMTSNAGTSLKNNVLGIAKTTESHVENTVHEALRNIFKPEFLNRVDEIIIFKSLSKKQQGEILDLMLEDLRTRVKEHGMDIEYSQESKDFLLDKGYSEQYGARPLRRVISKYVEDILAKTYLAEEMNGKNKAVLKLNKEKEMLYLDLY